MLKFRCVLLLMCMQTFLAEAKQYDVMSFNIRLSGADQGKNDWQNRKSLLLKTIKGLNPDIIGFQEVKNDQLEYLKDNLTDYDYYSVGRDDGKQRGEHASIFFKKDAFTLVEKGTWWLSDTPDTPGSRTWNHDQPRITSWLALSIKDSNEDFLYVFNTHWSCFVEEDARNKSALLTQEKIKNIADGKPFIFLGDLNTNEDKDAYKILMDRTHITMTDTFRFIHPHRSENEGTVHAFNGTRKGSRIDFIFTNLNVQNAEIHYTEYQGQYPSDHFPITTRIEYSF